MAEMREILFRGKRHDNGEWAYGSAIALDDEWQYIVPPHFGASTMSKLQLIALGMKRVVPNTIGQFTGLTDKDGVKIFEGDIILIGDSKEPVCVEFINFSWECTNKSIGPYYRHRLEDNRSKYKVIGNIYDKKREGDNCG